MYCNVEHGSSLDRVGARTWRRSSHDSGALRLVRGSMRMADAFAWLLAAPLGAAGSAEQLQDSMTARTAGCEKASFFDGNQPLFLQPWRTGCS